MSSERKPIVSIIVPAHNEERWIASCLESVLRDNYPHKEIIVVDDASTDKTDEILKRFPVVVVRNEKSLGPSSARNIGVRKANGEIIVFIDAHCIVKDSEWIQRFLAYFQNSEVGAVAGYFSKMPRLWEVSHRFRVQSQLRIIKSANAAYRKAVLEQVGGFDPYTEWAGDAALTFKVYRAGWRVVHSRDIKVVHAEKVWSLKRAFFYGEGFFPLLRKYPHEMLNKTQVSFFFMGVGCLLTFGIIADVFYRLPIFTPVFLAFFTVFNGASRNTPIHRMLLDGFYTTIWSFTYYLGALYGGIRSILSFDRS